MVQPILDDELWAIIQPLLPAPNPRRVRYPGRKPLDDRAVLTGILFVLQSGIPWEMLPQEMGCGSGMSCWRDYMPGKRLASGTVCTRYFWISFVRPIASTGLV